MATVKLLLAKGADLEAKTNVRQASTIYTYEDWNSHPMWWTLSAVTKAVGGQWARGCGALHVGNGAKGATNC